MHECILKALHPRNNPETEVLNTKQVSRYVWTSSQVEGLLDDYEVSAEKEPFERERARNSTEMEQQSQKTSQSGCFMCVF